MPHISDMPCTGLTAVDHAHAVTNGCDSLLQNKSCMHVSPTESLNEYAREWLDSADRLAITN